MKPLLPLFAILFAGIIAVPGASAQSAPPAQTLLNRAQGAFVTNRTVHVDLTLQESVSQVSAATSHVTADIAPGSGVAIERVTLRATSSNAQSPGTTQDVRFVLVKTRAAIRTSKGWQCVTAQNVTRQFGNIFTSLVPAVRKASVVRAETTDGVGTWHVHATGGASVPGQQVSLPTDLYISRADSTMVKETSSGAMTSQGHAIRESLVMHFSHYGEHVNAALPAACLKKTG